MGRCRRYQTRGFSTQLRKWTRTSVLELLHLIVSTGFFNYFHGHPVTAFENILEQVLDPTNTRHTQLYIHVAVENAHQLRVVRNDPRIVNFLLRVLSQGSRCCLTTFFWTLSPVRYVVLAFRLLCLGSKRLGKVLLVPPVSHAHCRRGSAICMGCRPYVWHYCKPISHTHNPR